jgi:hypothetical protein
MQKTTRVHEPKSGKGKPYSYEEVISFSTPKEAWSYLGIGWRDERAQLSFLAKEASRRNRERANANVNAPNAPKAPELKLLNNAVRIVNAPKKVAEAAKAGDVSAMERYQEVLQSLEATMEEATQAQAS